MTYEPCKHNKHPLYCKECNPMPTPNNSLETIREEFINHPELCGDSGYCNPIFANKISDWFLSKFSSLTEERIGEIKRMLSDYKTQSHNEDIKEIISLLKKDVISKEN